MIIVRLVVAVRCLCLSVIIDRVRLTANVIARRSTRSSKKEAKEEDDEEKVKEEEKITDEETKPQDGEKDYDKVGEDGKKIPQGKIGFENLAKVSKCDA